MASTYVRGKKLWCRLFNEHSKWISRPTPYAVGDEERAKRYAEAAQRTLDQRRQAGAGAPMTVAVYAERWRADRLKRGVRSAKDEKARIAHALPFLGEMRLEEVRPRHVRDMVRTLRAGELAPRTVRHVYGVVHGIFENAVIDELIQANPCKLKRGQDLPKKEDKDPEWRAQATYIADEVKLLITSPLILPDRRVLYALKALAGLRHGEAAALRWKHYNADDEPLGRLSLAKSYDSRAREEKSLKAGGTRRVPVHPVLAQVLAEWFEGGWEGVYGRKPKPGDLVVPTRAMTCRNSADANPALLLDLDALELRKEAGASNRGGHDLRAWFITTAQEFGAHRDLLRIVTHGAGIDVVSGYTRATWKALCAEVAKLEIALEPGEKALSLATPHATGGTMTRGRWGKAATPEGFEPSETVSRRAKTDASSEDSMLLADARSLSRTPRVARLATRIAEAVEVGNEHWALELLRALSAQDTSGSDE